jgi:hypothetical protein
MKNISVGDTVLIFWLATERWEPVNYRGRFGDRAVVVKDGFQLTVPSDDLRIEPSPAIIQCERCGREWAFE